MGEHNEFLGQGLQFEDLLKQVSIQFLDRSAITFAALDLPPKEFALRFVVT